MKKTQPTKEERNARAREWLRSHDLINIAALCRRIGYSRGTFWHFQDNKQDIGEDALVRLENALKEYGYDSKN